MKFDKLIESLVPIAGMAFAAAMDGKINLQFGDDAEHASTLADLDLSGDAPDAIVLASRDSVHVIHGDRLAIRVEGEAATSSNLRFSRQHNSLSILRQGGGGLAAEPATIYVTMPLVASIIVVGAGSIQADAVADGTEIVITGSGSVTTPDVAARKLDVLIAGSGNYRATGRSKKLTLSITGSGHAALDRLVVKKARITLTGSGDAVLRSDGEVSARIIGSGDIRVMGTAACDVRTMGSGRMVSEAIPNA